MIRRLIVASLATTLVGGCFFWPAIEDDGYVACDDDDDCAPGRSCALAVGLCAPPPWNDAAFSARRLLVVHNPGDVALPATTAIPVNVGGPASVLPLEELLADARYTAFDAVTERWRVVGVYRDLFSDRLTVWIPLARPLAPGARDALAWLEQGTETETPTVVEDPLSVFALFDDLDAFPQDAAAARDDTRYLVVAPRAFPSAAGGTLNVPDGVTVIWREALSPPVDVTFRARVNGLTCDEVYLGLTGRDAVGFNPPSAGFFMERDLLTVAEVAPTAASTPRPLSEATIFSEQPSALHRFRIQVDGAAVRFLVDDVVFDERVDLQPAFANDAPLFAMVQLGGDCSLDVDAVWATPLPAVGTPTVSAEPLVLLNTTY
jgi:hypothetical protein